ncbi:uncharacterized protein DS421_16g543560 [Arachis hypogaea]|nr:uncharacterized protein DS421_16g543560 [Arachis hypogaea]
MDGYLEQIRRNLGLPSIEDEDQSVSEEVEEKALVPSENPMKKEVVEVFEPMTSYPQRLLEVTEEHEDSLLKDLVEHHKEEREEDNQGSIHLHEA